MTKRTTVALPKIAVVADDLSGAMDTGAQFARAGLETLLLLGAAKPETQVLILNTRSREANVGEATQRMRALMPLLNQRWVFKKIDSTMRGHIGLEVQTLLNHLDLKSAVICPAVPVLGRQVRNGVLYLWDRPLHETPIASDPHWPMRSSDLRILLGGRGKKIPLEIVRSEKLVENFAAAQETFLLPDASTNEDLVHIADAALQAQCLPCGALAFAQAWLDAMGGSGSSRTSKAYDLKAPLLFAIGSHNPQARAQIHYLEQTNNLSTFIVEGLTDGSCSKIQRQAQAQLKAGLSVVISGPSEKLESVQRRKEVKRQIAAVVKRLLQLGGVETLAISGGDTAEAVLDVLGVEQILILGEITAGVPLGILQSGMADGMRVLTKAGDFGAEHVWGKILRTVEE